MANIIQYDEWTDETAQADERSAASGASDGAEIIKIPDGRNAFRFLPPLSGWGGKPFSVVWQHWFTDHDSKRFPVPCPRKNHSKRCPVCERAAAMTRTGNPVDADAAKALDPSVRVFANVLVRGSEDEGPKALSMPFSMVYKRLLAIRNDPDLGGNFTRADEGFDIIIKRTGQGLNTEYEVGASKHTSPLTELELGMVGQQLDVHKLAQMPTREAMERALGVIGPEVLDVSPPSGFNPAPRQLPNRTAADDLGYDGLS